MKKAKDTVVLDGVSYRDLLAEIDCLRKEREDVFQALIPLKTKVLEQIVASLEQAKPPKQQSIGVADHKPVHKGKKRKLPHLNGHFEIHRFQ